MGEIRALKSDQIKSFRISLNEDSFFTVHFELFRGKML